MDVKRVRIGEFGVRERGCRLVGRGLFFSSQDTWMRRLLEISRKCSSLDFSMFRKKSFVPQNSFYSYFSCTNTE